MSFVSQTACCACACACSSSLMPSIRFLTEAHKESTSRASKRAFEIKSEARAAVASHNLHEDTSA